MKTKRNDERGVALVEMALLTPFLVLLLLGMIEFGWLFAQNLDIKHGAREAARMLSVNDDPGGGGTQSQNIITGVCVDGPLSRHHSATDPVRYDR